MFGDLLYLSFSVLFLSLKPDVLVTRRLLTVFSSETDLDLSFLNGII